MNVTAVTEGIGGLFGYDHAQYDAIVRATPPGADGLVLLPHFDGERTPNLPDACGVLFGLRRGSLSPGHLARAAMEGVTFGMNYGLRRLRALGIRPEELRITGGGARSPAWRQVMADIFGVPVVAMVEDESAALGAALQAAWCASREGDRRETSMAKFISGIAVPDGSTHCSPNRRLAACYAREQALYDRLAGVLKDVYPRVSAGKTRA
jgi:xylulokinase